MPHNRWRVVLIAILTFALARSGQAETIDAARDQLVTGIVVVSAAIGVGVTLLVIHERHKMTRISGCVVSGANGMTVMDDKDKRTYALSGDPAGVKPGDRMTFEGKRKTANNMPVFVARRVMQDLGTC